MANETMEVQETEKQEIAESDVERTRSRACFIPRADIYETEDSIVIMADMPGVDRDSVDITLDNDILSINGYVEPEAPENYDLAYAEYREGDYQRQFTVSNQIDRENIEAMLKDGVLHLTLPKAQPSTKKISVRGD
jgi:HSP20 family molecular chaperone IbpA